MCEFCSNPNSNNDANHIDFAGFFSAEAIEAAVRKANANRSSQPKDDDSDGT
jgi:hypothetical protein